MIDVHDKLLADAAAVFGTTTTKDTVNAALREGVERQRRALALARLAAKADEGVFDALHDKRNYRS